MRATLPRCRDVRARLGGVEDLLGSAGGALDSKRRDATTRERFKRSRPIRGRVARVRGRAFCTEAIWRVKDFPSRRAAKSCENIDNNQSTDEILKTWGDVHGERKIFSSYLNKWSRNDITLQSLRHGLFRAQWNRRDQHVAPRTRACA